MNHPHRKLTFNAKVAELCERGSFSFIKTKNVIGLKGFIFYHHKRSLYLSNITLITSFLVLNTRIAWYVCMCF